MLLTGQSTFVPGISPGANVSPSFVPEGLYRLDTQYKCEGYQRVQIHVFPVVE
jgi:hypothetical protein